MADKDIEIGTRIELLTSSGSFKKGDKGTFVGQSKHIGNPPYGIRFDTIRTGHDCDGDCTNKHGRYLNLNEFKIILEPNQIVNNYKLY